MNYNKSLKNENKTSVKNNEKQIKYKKIIFTAVGICIAIFVIYNIVKRYILIANLLVVFIELMPSFELFPFFNKISSFFKGFKFSTSKPEKFLPLHANVKPQLNQMGGNPQQIGQIFNDLFVEKVKEHYEPKFTNTLNYIFVSRGLRRLKNSFKPDDIQSIIIEMFKNEMNKQIGDKINGEMLNIIKLNVIKNIATNVNGINDTLKSEISKMNDINEFKNLIPNELNEAKKMIVSFDNINNDLKNKINNANNMEQLKNLMPKELSMLSNIISIMNEVNNMDTLKREMNKEMYEKMNGSEKFNKIKEMITIMEDMEINIKNKKYGKINTNVDKLTSNLNADLQQKMGTIKKVLNVVKEIEKQKNNMDLNKVLDTLKEKGMNEVEKAKGTLVNDVEKVLSLLNMIIETQKMVKNNTLNNNQINDKIGDLVKNIPNVNIEEINIKIPPNLEEEKFRGKIFSDVVPKVIKEVSCSGEMKPEMCKMLDDMDNMKNNLIKKVNLTQRLFDRIDKLPLVMGEDGDDCNNPKEIKKVKKLIECIKN